MNKETSVILEMLRHIVNQPKSTQRDLARGLNLSLGKVNYCMKALKEKGYIKINNFKKNPDKISYVYILTPKGINEKTKLTVNFMKRKMIEYEDLKKELANDVKKNEKHIKKY